MKELFTNVIGELGSWCSIASFFAPIIRRKFKILRESRVWSIILITSSYVIGVILGLTVIPPNNRIPYFLVALFILFFLIKLPFYRGVFAVSAIIINDKHEILLIKESNDTHWKQPGGHYRMNGIAWRKKIVTPYDFIKERIRVEVGMDVNLLTDINMDGSNGIDDLSTLTAFDMGVFGKNIPSPTPFYVLQENAEEGIKKSSGEKYHIDFFFAFKVSNDYKLMPQHVKFMSLETIRESKDNEVYKDLYPVGESVIEKHKRLNYPKSKIRLCTFSNTYSRKLYWRLTKQCNAHCAFCISRSNANTEVNNISLQQIDELIAKILGGLYEKVVLTGGEPTLFSELEYVIQKIDEGVPSCQEISLCTNLIETTDDLLLKLCKYKKLKKFVVSVDSYNVNKFLAAKGVSISVDRSDFLKNINRKIKLLKGEGKSVTVNVVASSNLISNDYTSKYVDYWRDNKYDDISISYPVFMGTRNPVRDFRSRLLETYQKIISGEFGDVSFCKNMELIIPDCEMDGCANPYGIHSIDESGQFHKSCLEKEYRDNLIHSS